MFHLGGLYGCFHQCLILDHDVSAVTVYFSSKQLLLFAFEVPVARILVQVTINRRLLIGRDGHLDQSEAYDIS